MQGTPRARVGLRALELGPNEVTRTFYRVKGGKVQSIMIRIHNLPVLPWHYMLHSPHLT